MATQADFTNLEQLRLLDHGDAIERFYWPKVSHAISEYEVFWKRFVVLLTNRVSPFESTDWIMLRDGLPAEYESLLMANYSTLYHCVVSHEQIDIARKAKAERRFNHPELFFFSAKACLDNLGTLQSEAPRAVEKCRRADPFSEIAEWSHSGDHPLSSCIRASEAPRTRIATRP
jgi:hypothetical protein